MNREKLLEYFEKSSVINNTVDDKEDEVIGDRLDRIWYHEFKEHERRLVNWLLKEAYRTGENVTPEHAIEQIIIKLKENSVMMNVFENKEDYLKLRNFWKTFHAEGNHKPVKVEYRNSKPFQSGWSNGDMAFHMKSPLTLKHYMIYLAAVGKSLNKALAPTTFRETKEDLLVWVRGGE